MKLSDAVDQLRNARAAHKAWVARAEALIAGMNVDKEHIPMLPTDCVFGKWYYGDGQKLRNLPAYTDMEKPHDKLHRTYMQIFKLLFDEPDVSAFSRLFGGRAKAKKEQLEEAELLFKSLRKISEEVCYVLETLEDQLIATARNQNKSSVQ